MEDPFIIYEPFDSIEIAQQSWYTLQHNLGVGNPISFELSTVIYILLLICCHIAKDSLTRACQNTQNPLN